MDPPLIDDRWRRPAVAAAGIGALVFGVLAVLLRDRRRTAFDRWALWQSIAHISASKAQFVLGFTEPAVSIVLLGCLAVLSLSARRYDLAALAVVGPILGTVVASWVFKPVIHRTMYGGTVGSYPSGHETGVTCAAVVLLIAFGQLPVGRIARWVLSGFLVLWIVTSAIGLTRFNYHYATDTIGAAGWSIALVLSLALGLDRVGARLWARRQLTPRS